MIGKTGLTKEQKKRKKQDYVSEYIKERYYNDEEFRRRIIEIVRKSQKRNKELWEKQGWCNMCGRKRKNKRWKACEICRKRGREKSRKFLERLKNA